MCTACTACTALPALPPALASSIQYVPVQNRCVVVLSGVLQLAERVWALLAAMHAGWDNSRARRCAVALAAGQLPPPLLAGSALPVQGRHRCRPEP